MREGIPLLIASHLGAFAVGYAVVDARPVDEQAKSTGYFQIDTTKVLATTVESLREENRLLVYSYKGSAEVRAERRWLWLFGGRQVLIVPAVVPYYLDLSALTLNDVTFDKEAKIVQVRLPALTVGDIAFQPEGATTINGGILTWDDDEVEALRKLNYRAARRAVVAQAQQPGLLNAARKQAVANVQQYFEIPLRVAGKPDVRVAVAFR